MKPPARAKERETIIEFMENWVCFDHIAMNGCDHSSCYEIRRIQDALRKGLHLER